MWLSDPRIEEPNLLIPGRKPAGPVEINWSHPMTKGLKLCPWFSEGRDSIPDLVGGQWDRTTGNPGTPGKVDAGDFGSLPASRGLVGLDDTVIYQHSSYYWGGEPDGPRTLIVDQKYSRWSGNQYLFAIGQQAAGFLWRVRMQNNLFSHDIQGGWKLFNDSELHGNRNVYALVQPSSSTDVVDAIAYRNLEALTVNSSQSRTLNTSSSFRPLLFGSTPNLPTAGTKGYGNSSSDFGQINYLYFWERDLSEKEIQSLFFDPYQYLVPA